MIPKTTKTEGQIKKVKHRLLFEKLPVSVNEKCAAVRGRLISTWKYKTWLKAAATYIAFYCKQYNLKPIEKYTVVELFWVLPNHRADHHNFEKPLFDALQNGGAFKNDRFIINRTMQLDHVPGRESVTVEFEE